MTRTAGTDGLRVACVGNMNNNFFSLTRYLRDRGIDADLLTFDNEHEHFHPSADTYDREYMDFTTRLSWGSYPKFLSHSPDRIAQDLEPYDFLIGCGTAPAFARRAGRKLDVFVPYGDDLYVLPRFKIVNPRWQPARAALALAQRRGIRDAGHLHMGLTNPGTERVIQRLRGDRSRLLWGLPMIYEPVYTPDRMPEYYERSHWYHEFAAIRESNDLVVFHHGRHLWSSEAPPAYRKGNDRFLRGFAKFARRHPGIRAAVITCEYGWDVSESRQLAADLGIGDRVHWFPRMARKDVMVGLSLADIGTGQFGQSWLSCGTVLEVLAMGKPLMHHRRDELYEDQYSELYPLMNVRSANEIANALADYAAQPARFRAMGARGQRWFRRHVVREPVDGYVRLLGEL